MYHLSMDMGNHATLLMMHLILLTAFVENVNPTMKRIDSLFALINSVHSRFMIWLQTKRVQTDFAKHSGNSLAINAEVDQKLTWN